jgi:hypothetical protein
LILIKDHLDLGLSEVLPRAKVGVARPSGGNCLVHTFKVFDVSEISSGKTFAQSGENAFRGEHDYECDDKQQ